MSRISTVHRPFGVSLIGYLGVINAVLSIAIGVFVLVDRRDETLQRKSELTADELAATGIGSIAIGLFVLWVATSLLRGGTLGRVWYGLMGVVNASVGLYALVALHGEQRLAGAFALVIGLVVIYILFGDRDAADWFAAT